MGGKDIGINWNDIRANLTWPFWSRVFIFSTFCFSSSFFFLFALNTADFKMSWPSPSPLSHKLFKSETAGSRTRRRARCCICTLYRAPHDPQNIKHLTKYFSTINWTKHSEKKKILNKKWTLVPLTPCCHWFIVILMRYWIFFSIYVYYSYENVTIIRRCRLHRTS